MTRSPRWSWGGARVGGELAMGGSTFTGKLNMDGLQVGKGTRGCFCGPWYSEKRDQVW